MHVMLNSVSFILYFLKKKTYWRLEFKIFAISSLLICPQSDRETLFLNFYIFIFTFAILL